MGGILATMIGWIWGAAPEKYPPLGPDPDTPNPVTGLSLRQARAVLVTWDIIRPDLKAHGISLFVQVFKTYPDIQGKFKDFKGKDPESLRDNKRLAAHGTTVMTALSNIVDNLLDVEVLAEILKTTGKNHFKRGIEKENFRNLKKGILRYFGENLGDAWTPLAAESWDLALAAINSVIFAAYDELEN